MKVILLLFVLSILNVEGAVVDGGFEGGRFGGFWDEFSSNYFSPICDQVDCADDIGPFAGTYWAYFGGAGDGSLEDGHLIQSTDILTTENILQFRFYNTYSGQLISGMLDTFIVSIDGVTLFSVNKTNSANYNTPWNFIQILIPQFADGNSHSLEFFSYVPANSGLPAHGHANFMVDNVEFASISTTRPITSMEVSTNALTTAPLTSSRITSGAITSGVSITTSELTTAPVTSSLITSAAVTSSKITSGADVTTSEVTSSAITSGVIFTSNAITSSAITSNAVTSSRISAVTSNGITSKGITSGGLTTSRITSSRIAATSNGLTTSPKVLSSTDGGNVSFATRILSDFGLLFWICISISYLLI